MTGIALDGAVAVVTGAGRGIGRATALALAARGATVACLDLDGAAADDTARACGHGAAGLTVDVADRAAMVTAAEAIERDLGPVAVVVNNAGVGMSGRFLAMSEQDWAWIRGINLDGVVNGCAAFGPALRRRGTGHVVNVSSGLAYTHTATEPAYVTTKAAVLALSRCLRADWRAHGVRVSAVCPGVIATPIISATRFVGDDRDAERTARLFRRGHRPEKVAAAVLRALDRDRAVVPVGVEAHAGWYLARLAPVRVQERLVALAGRV